MKRLGRWSLYGCHRSRTHLTSVSTPRQPTVRRWKLQPLHRSRERQVTGYGHPASAPAPPPDPADPAAAGVIPGADADGARGPGKVAEPPAERVRT